MFGAILGAGASILGGILSSRSKNKATAAQKDVAMQELEYQKELHKNQIQWRVEDAKKAGLHPLAALGLSSASYSPVSSSIDSSGTDYSWIGDVGQNLNRSIMEGKTAKERQQALDRQAEIDKVNLRKANAEADLAETTAASERLRLQRELFPPAPPVNRSNGLIEGQSDAPSYTGNTSPLMQLSRMGNLLVEHINPDISDAVTESMIKNGAVMTSAEGQAGRTQREAFNALTPYERKQIRLGNAELVRIRGVGWQFLFKHHMKPSYDKDGSARGKFIPLRYW